ncbi:Holliday junction branch migration protein RuvA [Candidatus Endomicrobiellum devescovinae]|jgi:Holliday junction DNA helicase RuvA|uniref:Holliday junction branch migration protein RuvA n=1 Tax=Candidatus Endomicrobiellum devescovinae TaxID=3242322 RepID=UPI0028190305|nr:Holliday junction branch migration protein RuvA [Endomicrobium sp.]MDR2818062.1 Holliday junction branch migration protein RuvA [Endomicrobium sp.]
MLDYISGILESKSKDSITVGVSGIGYEAVVTVSTFSKLPEIGNQVKIYVVESVSGMYGGVICLYGFLTKEERDMYLLIKDEVPGIGAKKAMEYIDKISKSFADFKTAVISKNPSMLHAVFGFTKKTADKLIAALKDKIIGVEVSGKEKWTNVNLTENKLILEAIEGLTALGYKEQQARTAVNKIYEQDENITLENLITKSLQEF